nr:hypothetical protein [Bacillus licheniformis]
MNEKSAGYHERLPVAQTQSPLVNDKIKYWRSLFGDDDKWLNKAVSLLSHDPLSSIAQSSVSQSVGLKDSRRGPWQKMQKRIFETPFSYKDSALQDSELLFDSLLTRFASASTRCFGGTKYHTFSSSLPAGADTFKTDASSNCPSNINTGTKHFKA